MYTDDMIFYVGIKDGLRRHELNELIKQLKDKYGSEPPQLLQQTPCTALLEFLEQELIKEQKLSGEARFERDYGTHVNKANSISFVMKLIKERQPIA